MGTIPGTFIACGEGYNYCSTECIRQDLRENGEANWIVGYQAGAAVAFGIIGMFEAIRRNAPRLVERSYWTSELDGKRYYNCFCPGCGAYMKMRDAGVDEGTDDEWCGSCRY